MTKTLYHFVGIHLHSSYMLSTNQQVTLFVSRANLNGGFITWGGRGLTVTDANLEFRNQSKPLEWDVLSTLSASVWVRTLPRVQKITLTMVTRLSVWLKNVGGRSSELCPWIIFRPSDAAYRILKEGTQVLKAVVNEETLLRTHCCSWRFLARANGETFVSATMCPRLSVP